VCAPVRQSASWLGARNACPPPKTFSQQLGIRGSSPSPQLRDQGQWDATSLERKEVLRRHASACRTPDGMEQTTLRVPAETTIVEDPGKATVNLICDWVNNLPPSPRIRRARPKHGRKAAGSTFPRTRRSGRGFEPLE